MFDPSSYHIIIALFPRLLGAVYFFAFGAFIFQVKGLLGREGILPIEQYLRYYSHLGKKRFYYIPTLFWLDASDKTLYLVVAAGTILSLLLFLGFTPLLIFPLLYILHLSVVSAGQDFLSFGWEMFTLEITCNTFFLSMTSPPNLFVWVSINLLLLRFHFQGGASKLLSEDKTWRNLTALKYHYQTQPLPNAQAWYIYKLPLWFHKLSTAIMFLIELIVPLGMFGNEEMRFWVFICFAGLQGMIWFTGNFSYLNYLTLVLSTLLLSDTYLQAIFGSWVKESSPSPPLLDGFVSVVGIVLIALQLISLWNYFLPQARCKKILAWFQPFHIVNRYGIFAVMTTRRDEIIIEGSDDGIHWQEYLFRYKPSEITRRPRRISPYQPRIDWQAWFLPFSDFESESWFHNFLLRLLQGSSAVLKLLRHNPFPDKPPKYVRALLYAYEYSDADTKKKTGAWWKRELLGAYSPTLSLKHAEK